MYGLTLIMQSHSALVMTLFFSEIRSNAFLMTLSRHLIDYEVFLVGYMGYTIEEVASVNLSQDHKICVLKMLSLWRCKDGQERVKTVEELLSAMKDVLQRGPYKVLESLIRGKCTECYTKKILEVLCVNICKTPRIRATNIFIIIFFMNLCSIMAHNLVL